MWSVGDPTTQAAFLAALTQSHAIKVVAKSYLDGVELGDIPIVAGEVRVTGRQRVRRRATFTVPEETWTSSLSPYGVQVRIWRTVVVGGYTFPLIPVFTGRVENRIRVRKSGLVQVECWDGFAAVNDDAFDVPRVVPIGLTIPAAIAMLLTETHPDAVVTDTTGSASTIPAALAWDAGDGSRGQAVDKMALAIGAEVVALPDGNFLNRPYPTLTGSAVWEVATGAGGVIVSDAIRESRSNVANRWIVTGNQTGSNTSVRAVATDTSSPLRFDGPYGRVTRTYTDPMITTNLQAQTAGQALLARVAGLARQRTIGVIVNPALEAGDLIAVTTDDGRELHVADDFAVPLTADVATMAVATRSTELDDASL